VLELPTEFDPKSYRKRYPNLASLRRSELRKHWRTQGRHNSLNASPVENRDELLGCLQEAEHLLEIGPFDNPSLEFLRRPGLMVDYADHFSREEMVDRAQNIKGRDPQRIPPIRYVLAQGGYEQITQRYNAVVSHHCLEHQPDMILHLQQVATLLKPGGVYLCTLPDHRRCFDRFLPPTTLIDVVTAHLEARTRPPLQAVLEHRCFTVQNWRHAADPIKQPDTELPKRLRAALDEYLGTTYVDVHCWKFTNDRFRQLMRQLLTLNFLPAQTQWKTYNFGNEFAAAITFDHPSPPSTNTPHTHGQSQHPTLP
jgi:SAM-dependent methyltransferase